MLIPLKKSVIRTQTKIINIRIMKAKRFFKRVSLNSYIYMAAVLFLLCITVCRFYQSEYDNEIIKGYFGTEILASISAFLCGFYLIKTDFWIYWTCTLMSYLCSLFFIDSMLGLVLVIIIYIFLLAFLPFVRAIVQKKLINDK